MPIYPELTGGEYLSFLSGGVSATRLEMLFRRFDVRKLDLRRRMRKYSQGDEAQGR